MAEYQLRLNGSVIRARDGATIPLSAGNRDYREYLAWVKRGGIPDPPVVPPVVTEEDRAERVWADNPDNHALVKALAKRLDISPRTLLDEIRTEAKGARS